MDTRSRTRRPRRSATTFNGAMTFQPWIRGDFDDLLIFDEWPSMEP